MNNSGICMKRTLRGLKGTNLENLGKDLNFALKMFIVALFIVVKD